MSAMRIILFWESMFLRDVILALFEKDDQILISDYSHMISEEMIHQQTPSHILMEAGVTWQEDWLPQLLFHFENIAIVKLDMKQNQVHTFYHQTSTVSKLSDFIVLLEGSASSN